MILLGISSMLKSKPASELPCSIQILKEEILQSLLYKLPSYSIFSRRSATRRYDLLCPSVGASVLNSELSCPFNIKVEMEHRCMNANCAISTSMDLDKYFFKLIVLRFHFGFVPENKHHYSLSCMVKSLTRLNL